MVFELTQIVFGKAGRGEGGKIKLRIIKKSPKEISLFSSVFISFFLLLLSPLYTLLFFFSFAASFLRRRRRTIKFSSPRRRHFPFLLRAVFSLFILLWVICSEVVKRKKKWFQTSFSFGITFYAFEIILDPSENVVLFWIKTGKR